MGQYSRILCLGDSITFGARAAHGRTYPVLLEEHLSTGSVPVVCINAGVNGQTSWEIVERGWGYLGSDDWIKVCVALMGTNDSKPAYRTPLPDYEASWRRLARMCDFASVRLIAVEIPAIDPTGQPEYDADSLQWIRDANRFLTDWSSRERIPLIGDVFDRFADEPKLLADGIHPSNDGNRVIAELIAETMAKPLPSPH